MSRRPCCPLDPSPAARASPPAWSIPPMVRGISTTDVHGISMEEVQRREGCTESGEAWEEKTLVCGFVDGEEADAADAKIKYREAERLAGDCGLT